MKNSIAELGQETRYTARSSIHQVSTSLSLARTVETIVGQSKVAKRPEPLLYTLRAAQAANVCQESEVPVLVGLHDSCGPMSFGSAVSDLIPVERQDANNFRQGGNEPTAN